MIALVSVIWKRSPSGTFSFTCYNVYMSYLDELQHDIDQIRKSADLNIDELMRLSAIQERVIIFNRLRDLIQEKDTSNDAIAASVLAWAWEELSS